jgi:ABC-2 type transport system ATP-binding protein
LQAKSADVACAPTQDHTNRGRSLHPDARKPVLPVLVTEPSAAEPGAPPLMVADGLLATGPRGRIFGPITVRVAAGELLAVTGPGGSGRTALLLALSGRLRVAGGRLIVGGHVLEAQASAIRSLVAVARAGNAVDLDEFWTVDDAIADRAVLTGDRPAGAVEGAVRARLTGAGVDVPPATPLYALTPLARTLLDLALAAVEDRPVVVLDDADRGLGPAGERRVWEALRALAGEGRAVVAVTTDPRAANSLATTILPLEPAL